jgi:hypothetical protein
LDGSARLYDKLPFGLAAQHSTNNRLFAIPKMARVCSAAKLISNDFCCSSDGLSLRPLIFQLRRFGIALLLSGGFISDSRKAASETSRFAYRETRAAAVNVRADLSDHQQDEADNARPKECRSISR